MNRVARLCSWIYFQRVPLLTLTIIGVAGWFTAETPLFGNITNMSGHRQQDLFLFAVMTVLACSSAVSAMNIINFYAGLRFGVAPPFMSNTLRRAVYFSLGVASAGSLMAAVETQTPGLQFGILIAGGGAGALIVFVIKLLHMIFSRPTAHPEFYVFPADSIPGLGAALKRLAGRGSPLGGRLLWAGHAIAAPIRAVLGQSPGYFDQDGKLRSGHVFAIVFQLVSLSFYAFAGGTVVFGDFSVVKPWPSLNFLLLFLSLVCWTLTGITFFLDRFRVPVLAVVLAAIFTSGMETRSDHYYRILDRNTAIASLPTPAQALSRFGDSPVLVAAAGGGIQAAAWTTQVLTGLEQKDRAFRQSLALLSGVSGGAVGTMFYLQTGTASVKYSQESSLEHVTWGWLKPDVIRTIPFFAGDRTRDRGLALEQSWEKRIALKGSTMWDWGARIGPQSGGLPAVIFSATAAENGDPLLFANTGTGGGIDGKANRLPKFHDVHPGRTIEVVTAARMCSTFPFVSPTARPTVEQCEDVKGQRLCTPSRHLVDGGYYDVSGVVSLLDWLEDALSDPRFERLPRRILIIRIKPFADAASNPAGNHSGLVRDGVRKRGWAFQITAPIFALYNVREAGQQRNAIRHLSAFQQIWSRASSSDGMSQVKPRTAIPVSIVDITFPSTKFNPECREPPLSWRLNDQEKKCIAAAWEALNNEKNTTAKCLQSIYGWTQGGSIDPTCEVQAFTPDGDQK